MAVNRARPKGGLWFTARSVQVASMHLPSHCVYVLVSLADGKFYIGYSADLPRRMSEHEGGRSRSTASRRPFRLVYSECFLSANDALRREGYFKTAKGKRTLRLMLRESLACAIPTKSDSGKVPQGVAPEGLLS